MSELSHKVPQQEYQSAPEGAVTYELHGQTVEIPNKPLYDAATARELYGVHGAIMAEMSLPALTPDNRGVKTLALVDTGSRNLAGKDQDQDRFILMPLNYSQRSEGKGYRVVQEGATVVGRSTKDREWAYNDLGLYDTPDNHAVSRRHFTVTRQGDNIFVSDHSRYGMGIKTALPESGEKADKPKVYSRAIGTAAAQQAGVEHVPVTVEQQIDEIQTSLKSLTENLSADDRKRVWAYGSEFARLKSIEAKYPNDEKLWTQVHAQATDKLKAVPDHLKNTATAYGNLMAKQSALLAQ